MLGRNRNQRAARLFLAAAGAGPTSPNGAQFEFAVDSCSRKSSVGVAARNSDLGIAKILAVAWIPPRVNETMSNSATTFSPLWPGVPLALASAVLFGASAPFAKLLLGSTDPQLLAGLLYLGAGLGLAIGQVGRSVLGVRASEAPLRRADLPWLIAIIAFGGVMGRCC